MNQSNSHKITVKALDLSRITHVYDGNPENWHTSVTMPMGLPEFTLAEIDRQNFSELEAILGTENFNIIITAQGYVRPQTQFETYRSADGLPIQYYVRPGKLSGIYKLILVSFGEFQPCRWIANLEGIWHVTGIDFPTSTNGNCAIL